MKLHQTIAEIFVPDSQPLVVNATTDIAGYARHFIGKFQDNMREKSTQCPG
jgi:hypothetical protein